MGLASIPKVWGLLLTFRHCVELPTSKARTQKEQVGWQLRTILEWPSNVKIRNMNIIKGHQYYVKLMESFHGQLVAESNLSGSKLNARDMLIGLFLFIWTMLCYITPHYYIVIYLASKQDAGQNCSLGWRFSTKNKTSQGASIIFLSFELY